MPDPARGRVEFSSPELTAAVESEGARISSLRSAGRELLLVTVKTGEGGPRVGELVAQFGARIVDRSDDAMTIMLADHPERLDELESQVAGQGILAVQRTGRIALPLA